MTARRELYVLLDELVRFALRPRRGPLPPGRLPLGLDVSRHDHFGFLRLRAEFETQGQGPLGAKRREFFGCSLEQLKDAVAATLGADVVKPARARSPLEALRDRVRRRGHPDFR